MRRRERAGARVKFWGEHVETRCGYALRIVKRSGRRIHVHASEIAVQIQNIIRRARELPCTDTNPRFSAHLRSAFLTPWFPQHENFYAILLNRFPFNWCKLSKKNFGRTLWKTRLTLRPLFRVKDTFFGKINVTIGKSRQKSINLHMRNIFPTSLVFVLAS